MTFLEPIIASLIGAATVAAAVFLKKNLAVQTFLKYGPIIKKAYDIIDPVLDQNLSRWDGSKIDKAFELSVESVADGKLSPEEIKHLAFEMAKHWLPQKAADKVRAFQASSPELRSAAIVAAKVDAMTAN
jgi:hypothetical protein